MTLCSVEGCERKRAAKGLCGKHYHRWRNSIPLGVSTEDLRKRRRLPEVCIVDGCERRPMAKSMCQRHYQTARNRRDRATKPDRYLGYHLNRYGITVEDYKALLAAQDDACAICGRKQRRRLSVDHDHSTGAVRGLLCVACNVGIGHFGDDPERLVQAWRYLTRA